MWDGSVFHREVVANIAPSALGVGHLQEVTVAPPELRDLEET